MAVDPSELAQELGIVVRCVPGFPGLAVLHDEVMFAWDDREPVRRAQLWEGIARVMLIRESDPLCTWSQQLACRLARAIAAPNADVRAILAALSPKRGLRAGRCNTESTLASPRRRKLGGG